METEAIALVVDEPIAGHFYWVLQRRDGGDCRPVDAAEGPMPTYGAAMMAGIAALQRRADARGLRDGGQRVVTAFMGRDSDVGPRTLH